MKRWVVAGGGAVGGLFAGLLRRDGAHVTVVDVAGDADLVADVTAPSPQLAEALATADAVLLALPEPVIVDALPHLSAGLIVDTSSVKTAVVSEAPAGAEWVSINPMFAPSLGMSGRPVAAVEVVGGSRTEEFLAAITRWGGHVVRMSAPEHDRVAAVTQSMTHAAILAFGLAVQDLGIPLRTLGATAPPPHRTMLALLARLLSQSPDVYWDIQLANPDAGPARAALAGGLRRLAALVDGGDARGFAATLAELRVLFGDDLPAHQSRAAHLFTLLEEKP